MTNTDYIDDIVLLANTKAQAESLLHNLEQVASILHSETLYKQYKFLFLVDINQIKS